MKPRLMHGCDWSGQDVSGWWASEKLDGWRAYWTGDRFLSRQGELLDAPAWFLSGMPSRPLDGELWAGKGTSHDQVNACIRSRRWDSLTFRPFDVPELGFKTEAAQALIKQLPLPRQAWPVDYIRISSTNEAIALMRYIVAQGGEGIMLRAPNAGYSPDFRTEKLLKLKPHLVI